MRVEIMDTTLRDGEQTTGVAFTPAEKLSVAKMLLDEVRVDRIEVGSARVSEGELEAVRRIVDWSHNKGCLEKVEVLGFVDGAKSLDWINKAGARVVNVLSKGSLKHLEIQLRKNPERHVADIREVIRYAEKLGIKVNIYFEDWSNGMRHSPDYVFYLMDSLKTEKIERFMLPDTLGVLNPDKAFEYCRAMVERCPGLRFDFHAHNDYDLAVANSLSAAKAGCTGIHATINGLGERAGNASLSSVIVALSDQLGLTLSADETKLGRISKLVESFTGIRMPPNKPIVGENVFTQCCGVHADGDAKGDLYAGDLRPERFGRARKYALGKMSGKASIQKNLEKLGIELDAESMRKVVQRVVELGDKKEYITTGDLPYIISDVIGSGGAEDKVRIKNYSVGHAYGLKPAATLSIEIDGRVYNGTSSGDGQYDAFMKALSGIYGSLAREFPTLADYLVTIPPGGRTDALVETVITWRLGNREFKTRGLDPDQTAAAIEATLKMLNIIEKMNA